ncbi:MAG: hypothetical protein RI891_315 [Gemmatimonadota bacterium]|jgi:hypothetical protein
MSRVVTAGYLSPRYWTTRGRGSADSPVTLVARGTDESAIEGLAAGAVVVLYPPEALTDGSAVRR